MTNHVSKRWHCALLIWIVAYPLITTLTYVLEPIVAGWPLPLRTLLISSIMVPSMVLWLVPAFAQKVSIFVESVPPTEQVPAGNKENSR